MPGILGFIMKNGRSWPSKDFLESMLYPLRHMESYNEEKHFKHNFGFGSIAPSTSQRVYKRTSKGQEYVILIDGCVYSVSGRAIQNVKGIPDDLLSSIVYAVQSGQDSDFLAIEGNYSIAVYNITREKLTLFNDIIGPRRLYYANFHECFVFSSEVKAISALSAFYGELNWKGITDFLNYGYILGEDTFFSDIWSLPSASALMYDRQTDGMSIRKYWRPVYNEMEMSFEDVAKTTYTLLCNSIHEKINATNGSVISPISGGLDSRIILGILTDIAPDLHVKACTHAQKFSNEYKYAKQVCRTLNIKEHYFAEVLPRYLQNKYRQAVWFSEGMVPLTTNAHLMLYPDQMNSFDSVVFTGIYGGPTNYHAEYYGDRHIENEYRGEDKIYDIRKVISLNENAYNKLVSDKFLERIQAASFESISKEFSRHIDVSSRFCNQRDAFFIENRMRRMICQTDLFRFFWEEQLPLSNYALYKNYLQIPAEYKIGKKILKQMLIDNFESLARIKDANTNLTLFQQPSKIYQLKKQLSHKIRWYLNKAVKGKMPFYDKSTYIHYAPWFQKNNAMFNMWKKALKSEKLVGLEIVDPRKIDDAIAFTRKTGLGIHPLARLTTLSIWADLFLN